MTNIRLATRADEDAWLAMRAALWPEAGVDDLKPEVAAFFAGRMEPAMLHRLFVAEGDEGALVGMLELSLRPYVDGCEGSPVPYVEAWYVVPQVRRQGIGAALVKAEDWALAHGYHEMASDALLDNHVSEHAHKALGFAEVERAIRFRKALKG